MTDYAHRPPARLRSVTERARAFLRGMGSLLDIYPEPRRYEDLIPKGTAEERLAGHWQRVGQYIAGAMQEVDDEIALPKKESRRKRARRR